MNFYINKPKNSIPTLSLVQCDWGSLSSKKNFSQNLGQALHEHGFVLMENNFLPVDLNNQIFNDTAKFFSLPNEIKQKYEHPQLCGERGYVSKGRERSKKTQVGDLKEFFSAGRELRTYEAKEGSYFENIWPEEIPTFRNSCLESYERFYLEGVKIMHLLALYLDLPEDYFDQIVYNSNHTLLRVLHHYQLSKQEKYLQKSMRTAEHTNINFLTLALGRNFDALQGLDYPQRRRQNWLPIAFSQEKYILAVGDMLAWLTNDKLPSANFRVVNSLSQSSLHSQYIVSLYLHPHEDFELSVLPSCIDNEHPKKYSDATAGALFDERLRAIGLKY
ncbi:MAG: hypothetical protein A2233_02350 [Candidatus Kerfeldbacteria bacterium RIFOXYA2_FULL_38_24]|uniref:Isopenicillin N synthase-like Fe(2+) 2OG dioxygenase domain-containing protein n=1 Tax=Candidatus Kerfeldbacteria bacterium RIFOXYB2_FULL_38_14 TaxID=1798547 RepID=A0A1G2BEW9_9BACT|nr:MAG: hypothetical protein A2319_04950 [Candidatus Kerfeldbacteria bacterium RIFOXYB2_FULL_38_14]OGY87951.1 MAG: hypothetical protein A2233_02350 [Candidatus Kerfeldbacteria bacterium RIFOXYA2_FULL_38_24]OGY88637.1 MAG: hypothetical protein A2458_03255 [Candidatus Kerfeldbacteria bacterium RIFOXYC2_FULL_38_9]